ncbi:hypothetical protein P152DRAFT_470936 [Eremomyces bilateralis CBS 781.70]|uniref:Uncharacterized protein n=1 Tax=Eremomyces bilateralis CBS 781.70 TaxID=1392243 RepID=A0A6G1GBS4_9PEZI|nr:uncharacterized protein P152DRAFT_470936 [Eremomyces bilateralis CBS 781.70]KAF1815503.1 hypothetical protein P152DRAFT_470936 [Eremomyces bilateralis CBS 781.70]
MQLFLSAISLILFASHASALFTGARPSSTVKSTTISGSAAPTPLSFNPGGPMIPASAPPLSFNPGGPIVPAPTPLSYNPGGPMISASSAPCTSLVFIGMKHRRDAVTSSAPDTDEDGWLGGTCTWHETYVVATSSVDCKGCVLRTVALGHGPVRLCDENVTVATGTETIKACAASATVG